MSVLLDWNPWFEEELPDALLGINRQYAITDYTLIPEIKILEGVRRSGKSTLLYQVAAYAIAQQKTVLYINFDDELLKQCTLADLYYTFLEYKKVDYLLIDEIQQCQDWVPFVRKLYDRKIVEQIWITGSNTSLIKKEYAELLTGRNIKLPIALLSFSEYLLFKGMENPSLAMGSQNVVRVKKLFDEYLTLGAFPAITLRSVLQRELLNNYFDDFIYKDIAGRYTVNNAKLKELAIYLMTQAAKRLSYRKVANVLGLHVNTVMDYVTYFKEIFLFDEIYKFDYALKKQYLHHKKIYAIDTGLVNVVAFRFSEDKGRMLETLVYQHLKRLGGAIYFHQAQKECDFIVKEGLTVTKVIQVTCSLSDPDTKARELAGLTEAMMLHRSAKGLILTLDESDSLSLEIHGEHKSVDVLPVWQWMLGK